MKRAAIFIVVLLVLSGLIGGLSYFHFVMKPQIIRGVISTMVRPAATVAVVEARTQSFIPRISAIGTFRPVQGIDVAPQVGGIVEAIHFESSQEVAKGAPLIAIDDSTEQADLKSGQAQMKNAEASLSRQQQLILGGNTAKASVDQALAARDMAVASVDRAEAIIAQKTISAPFAGRLGIRKVDLGQYLSPGTAIVTLTQLDPIYVDFPVPEQSLSVIKPGQTSEIRVDAYPDETFQGVIKSIDSRVSQDSRSVLIRAELPNPTKKLFPGMFANVAVLSGAPRDVVTVPRTSVTYSLYGDSLYVAEPAPPSAAPGSAQAATSDSQDFIVERRFVRTGVVTGDSIAVLEGLKAGEMVVSEGQIKLMPGAHVHLDRSGGLQPRAVLPRE